MAYRIDNSVPQISTLNLRSEEQSGANNVHGRPISLRPSGEPDKDFASLMTKKIRSLQGIVSSEFAFQNKLTGTYKVTHQDGSSFEGGIRDGLADGEGRTFDSGGRLLHEGGYKKGEFDGYGVEYWLHNGSIHLRGNWKLGKLEGEMEYGSLCGDKIWYGVCKNGTLLGEYSDFPFNGIELE